MAPEPILHTCQSCGKPLRGRSDKKFCDPGCKNTFNNRLQSQERAAIGQIDLILKRNRRILKACLGPETSRKISQIELLQRGLRFEYHTHHFANHRLDEYCFCYDYGYLELGEGKCLVVRSKGL